MFVYMVCLMKDPVPGLAKCKSWSGQGSNLGVQGVYMCEYTHSHTLKRSNEKNHPSVILKDAQTSRWVMVKLTF